jgi:hypothetical protein
MPHTREDHWLKGGGMEQARDWTPNHVNPHVTKKWVRHADMLDEITRDETTRSKPHARTHERARSADTGDDARSGGLGCPHLI